MIRSLFLLLLVFSAAVSEAVTFYIEGLPNSDVFYWNRGSSSSMQTVTGDMSQYQRVLVDIPDEYVVYTDKDHIDMRSSLENWRRNTPKGPSHPLTVDGVARFPFRIEGANLDPRERYAPRSFQLAEILENIEDNGSLRISSGDGKPVEMKTEKPALIQDLEKIRETNGPVSCRKPKSIDSPAVWTPAECMLCNCVNESLASAPPLDRLAIHKVVLRRMVSSNENVNRDVFYQHPAYGRSICGTVLGKKRFGGRIGLQFSWTSGPPRQTIFEIPAMHASTMSRPGSVRAPGRANVLKDCVDTAIQALNDTVNGQPASYDHYHNTSVCPDWARQKNGCTGRKIHLHRYYSLYPYTDGNMDLLKAEMGASEPAIIRPLQTDFWPEGGNPNEVAE